MNQNEMTSFENNMTVYFDSTPLGEDNSEKGAIIEAIKLLQKLKINQRDQQEQQVSKSIDILLSEVQDLISDRDQLKEIIEVQQSQIHQQEQDIIQLKQNLDFSEQQNNQIHQQLRDTQRISKEAVTRSEKLRHQIDEIQKMWDQDNFKLRQDHQKILIKNQNLTQNFELIQSELDQERKLRMQASEELDRLNQRKKEQIQKLKQQTREQYEREMIERTTLLVVTKDNPIIKQMSMLLTPKELSRLSCVNKILSETLTKTIGATAWKNNFVIQHRNRHPIVQKQVDSMNSKLKFGTSNFDKCGGLEDSQQSMQQLIQRERMHSSKLEQFSKDEYLTNCIQKYVCDNVRLTSKHDVSLEKAQTLLATYAKFVYSEEQIREMSNKTSLDRSGSPSQPGLTGGLMRMFTGMVQNSPQSQSHQPHEEQKTDFRRAQTMDLNSSTLSLRTSVDESVHIDNADMFVRTLGSPNDIYKFLIKVAGQLVQEKEKINNLFKKMQHSFSELVFYGQQISSEAHDLELIKDFFKLKIDHLKAKIYLYQKNLSDLQVSRDKEKSRRKQLERKIQEIDRKGQEKDIELQKYKKRTRDQEARITDAEQVLQQQYNNLKHLQQESETEKAKNAELSSRLNEWQSSISEFKGLLEGITRE